ncbi:MAG: sugar transferase [Planctomycetota bacterium]|nr:sugar transferase [Planctomycetota bacterium]
MPRPLELIITTIMIVLLAPVMVVVALLVLLSMGSPVLFRQHRHGLRGADFRILKFRTMVTGTDSDAARMTRLGRMLRATSLDELPELFNVLRGEMSLVGPRPLLPEYLELYDERQRRRLDVKPGITGWAQVHGRNTVGWPERFEMDVWYVENRGMLLDLRILVLTLVQVFRVSEVSQAGHATQERFTGNDE